MFSARPGNAEPAAYRRALRLAQTLCELLPFEGMHLTTLGILQYRLGHYHEALDILMHAEELNQAARGEPTPADLAFLAMTQYQLGEKAKARAFLDRLHETMQKANWVRNDEAQDFLKEAERLLQRPPLPRSQP